MLTNFDQFPRHPALAREQLPRDAVPNDNASKATGTGGHAAQVYPGAHTYQQLVAQGAALAPTYTSLPPMVLQTAARKLGADGYNAYAPLGLSSLANVRNGIDTTGGLRYLLPQNDSGKSFRRGPLLAHGGFSKIYPVVDELGDAYVLRVLHLHPQRSGDAAKSKVGVSTAEDILAEFQALSASRSPLLPKWSFHYAVGPKSSPSIKLCWVIPRYDADFAQLLYYRITPPTPAVLRHVLRTLGGQVATLHAQSLVHRDIKPANIFYRRGGEMVLGDYGLVASTHGLGPGAGTLGYMAPENFYGAVPAPTYGTGFDVYALGLTLSELAYPTEFARFPIALRKWWQLAQTAQTAQQQQKLQSQYVIADYDAGQIAAAAMVDYNYSVANAAFEGSSARRFVQGKQMYEGIAPLFAQWAQKDAWGQTLLPAPVVTAMLDPHPDTRTSMAAALRDLEAASANSPEADANQAAAYFDALLAAKETSDAYWGDDGAKGAEAARTLPAYPLAALLEAADHRATHLHAAIDEIPQVYGAAPIYIPGPLPANVADADAHPAQTEVRSQFAAQQPFFASKTSFFTAPAQSWEAAVLADAWAYEDWAGR